MNSKLLVVEGRNRSHEDIEETQNTVTDALFERHYFMTEPFAFYGSICIRASGLLLGLRVESLPAHLGV